MGCCLWHLILKLIFKQIYKILDNAFDNVWNISLLIFIGLLTTMFKGHKLLCVALT